jgi:hypothetical protein
MWLPSYAANMNAAELLHFPRRDRLSLAGRSALRRRSVSRTAAQAQATAVDVGTIIDQELKAFGLRMAEEAAAVSARVRARIASEVMGIAPVETAKEKRAQEMKAAAKATADTYRAPPPGRMTKVQVEEMRAAVLSLFRPGVPLSAGDVGERLKLDRHRVTLALDAHVQAKTLKRTGKARWARYQRA